MNWDEDTLDYGYVVTRLAGGEWWHLHFGRSCWSYQAELLGRQTDILACVQKFAAWAVAKSPRFFLTLDGEGVELPDPAARLDCLWGERPMDVQLAAAALHFQQEIMPLLFESPGFFQRAIAEIVARQRYMCLAASGKLTWVG